MRSACWELSSCTSKLARSRHPSLPNVICATRFANPTHSQHVKLTVRNFSSPAGRNTPQNRGSLTPSLLLFIACIAGIGIWTSKKNPNTSNDAPSPFGKLLELPAAGNRPMVWIGMVHPALDLATATVRLRVEEESTGFVTKKDVDVTRVDTLRVPSNSPTEDRWSYGVANVGDVEDWKFWGVYDGHAGWATSEVLQHYLTSYVAQSLRKAKKTSPTFSPETIDKAIKAGFLNLDDEIIYDGLRALSDSKTHAEAISRIAPARAGSCALLAVFDPTKATVRVACTGDSRAVLGRRQSTDSESTASSYVAEALSIDQTGFNEKERERVNTAHPDEPDTIDIKTGRILGLAVTRAFGDHRWKWPAEAITKAESNFFATPPRPKYHSPPYLTAEPEVTTTKITQGDFLILASDGLWDHMSSEDAVECVRMWINQRTDDDPATGPATATTRTDNLQANNSEKDAELKFDNEWRSTPEHFVVEDTNAATHLVRNALGGSRRDLFCSVMSIQSPDSRNVRDDITVQVIFFGGSDTV